MGVIAQVKWPRSLFERFDNFAGPSDRDVHCVWKIAKIRSHAEKKCCRNVQVMVKFCSQKIEFLFNFWDTCPASVLLLRPNMNVNEKGKSFLKYLS